MRERVLRRAVIVASVLILAMSAAANADTLLADGDLFTPEAEGTIDLGQAEPGATVTYELWFVLTCTNTHHLDPDQTVTLQANAFDVPGGSISATTVTVDAPEGWPLDGEECPSDVEPALSNGRSTVTIVAPMTPGNDYKFEVGWERQFSPWDSSTFGSSKWTFATFVLDVVSPNTPPSLELPATLTLEGDTAGGAFAAYSVGATDVEDDPDPVPSCSPAPGDFVPLGTSHVACTVTDTEGATTTGGFDLTVVDTTAPILAGVPSGLALVTADAGGATLAYDLPTATDVVDADPIVACDPGPGATAPIGDSIVTCTATDDSGNVASATFPVHVSLPTARWDSPVGGDPASLVGNYGRTVPVKVALLVGGVEYTTGPVELVVGPCGGGDPLLTVPMSWQPDARRWFGHLDTSLLPGPACYTATAWLGGTPGPSFQLDLVSGAASTAGAERGGSDTGGAGVP